MYFIRNIIFSLFLIIIYQVSKSFQITGICQDTNTGTSVSNFKDIQNKVLYKHYEMRNTLNLRDICTRITFEADTPGNVVNQRLRAKSRWLYDTTKLITIKNYTYTYENNIIKGIPDSFLSRFSAYNSSINFKVIELTADHLILYSCETRTAVNARVEYAWILTDSVNTPDATLQTYITTLRNSNLVSAPLDSIILNSFWRINQTHPDCTGL